MLVAERFHTIPFSSRTDRGWPGVCDHCRSVPRVCRADTAVKRLLTSHRRRDRESQPDDLNDPTAATR